MKRRNFLMAGSSLPLASLLTACGGNSDETNSSTAPVTTTGTDQLTVTASVFSGRQNPSWVISDPQEIRSTLKQIADLKAVGSTAASYDNLGSLSEFAIDIGNSALAKEYGLSGTVYLPMLADGSSDAVAERLIGLASVPALAMAESMGGIAASQQLQYTPIQKFMLDKLKANSVINKPVTSTASAEKVAQFSSATSCTIDYYAFNGNFWNLDDFVRRNNNCYAYAVNRKTNTFPQPGRWAGKQVTGTFTAQNVTDAAMADGMKKLDNCPASTDTPRHVVALVISNNPSFNDYHWYRKLINNEWGHKPGQTKAKQTDNSGVKITNPELCDRGDYGIFAGYFIASKAQNIK